MPRACTVYNHVSYGIFLFKCPSTIGDEKQYNVQLRTSKLELLERLGLALATDVARDARVDDETRAKALKELRKQKDKFKYIQ